MSAAVEQMLRTAANVKRVLTDVARERARQQHTWGEQNHPDGTGKPLDADMANATRETCQRLARTGKVTWRAILAEEVTEAYAESDPQRLRTELVQVAAVASAWVEAIDRREGNG